MILKDSRTTPDSQGGYSAGSEDYRWEEIRKWFPGWKFEVFNLIFIVFFQQAVILGFSSPAAVAMQNSDTPLGFVDGIAATLFVIFWIGETIADQQMFDFQTEKYRRIAAKEPAGKYSKGFIDTGLWSWSRHPNYFCEVSLWWAYWLFSVGASGTWINFSFPGPFFLTLLFVSPRASCDVTELLSGRKYAQFADYQRRVSKFIPWWPHETVDSKGKST